MDVSQLKNNTPVYDFIIVGHGLAGSVLAIQLIKAGYHICVIDEESLSLSSKVAAGIWNPVVFKRLTKSWLADELIPALNEFYSWFEDVADVSLITPRNIIKSFTEEQEKVLWQKKSQTENQFLDNQLYSDLAISMHDKITSYSKVLNAGNLDIRTFLEASRKFIESRHRFLSEKFDYAGLSVSDSAVNYKGINARNVVFAEGYLISQNPYFNWVPMKPAKGEVLTIHCDDFLIDKEIINKGIFIMPLGNHKYKVGATYEWNDLNDIPSDKGKTELETKLKALITVPFHIIEHEAGVRPAVIDRRPVIGSHPDHSNLYVFNGFGTKAVMLVPYFAIEFLRCFAGKIPLDQVVNVNRFQRK